MEGKDFVLTALDSDRHAPKRHAVAIYCQQQLVLFELSFGQLRLRLLGSA